MELSTETKAGLRLLSDPTLNVSALSAAALALALGRATTDRVAGTSPSNVRCAILNFSTAAHPHSTCHACQFGAI